MFGDLPYSIFALYKASYLDRNTLLFGFFIALQNSYQNPPDKPLQY